MKGKSLYKNRANGNDDDQHDQGHRISARPAAGPSTPAVMTKSVCDASSDMDVSSEEEVTPAAMGMSINHQQVFMIYTNYKVSRNLNGHATYFRYQLTDIHNKDETGFTTDQQPKNDGCSFKHVVSCTSGKGDE